MPAQKTPEADLRRRYPLYAEVGLALALGLAVLAFTVPTPAPEPVSYAAEDDGPVPLVDVPPTAETPPPPPPPAPPPPVAVPDDAEAVDDAIAEIVLTLEDDLPPPPAPPARAAPAPPAPPTSPPPPPPPPVAPEVTDDEIIDFAEVQPELIGGLEALQRSIDYPEVPRRAGIEGRVIIQFVVDERGNVVDPVVARSPNDALSEAALAAVRKAKFRPGQQRGRPVKVRFSLPVTFRLR